MKNKIAIEPREDCCLWKMTVDLNEYEDQYDIFVGKGCRAVGVHEVDNRKDTFEEYEDSVYHMEKSNNEKNGFLARLFSGTSAKKYHLYIANNSIVIKWGVSGVAHKDWSGVKESAGYYGELEFEITNPERAYTQVISVKAANVKTEEMADSLRALKKGERDEIIKEALAQYYQDHDKEKLVQTVKSKCKALYQESCGLTVTAFSVGNLDDPRKEDGQAEKERVKTAEEKEMEQILKQADQRKNARVRVCSCGAENADENATYCPRCGKKYEN